MVILFPSFEGKYSSYPVTVFPLLYLICWSIFLGPSLDVFMVPYPGLSLSSRVEMLYIQVHLVQGLLPLSCQLVIDQYWLIVVI